MVWAEKVRHLLRQPSLTLGEQLAPGAYHMLSSETFTGFEWRGNADGND
jgi:hypothetical protein